MSDQVEVGQVWADNDYRSRGRTLRVIQVNETHARCVILTNITGNPGLDRRGTTTKIALRRFRPTSTGYRLVSADQ